MQQKFRRNDLQVDMIVLPFLCVCYYTFDSEFYWKTSLTFAKRECGHIVFILMSHSSFPGCSRGHCVRFQLSLTALHFADFDTCCSHSDAPGKLVVVPASAVSVHRRSSPVRFRTLRVLRAIIMSV